MLAATERSVEISRQRRTQLRFVGVSNTADCRLKTSSRFSNQPNSQRDVKRVDTAATNAALKRVGMSTAEDGVQRSIGGITSGNSASSRAISNDNRKLNNTNKQLRRVRIRRHNSVISNSVTPPETWTVESPESCVPNVDGAVAQEPLLIATPQRSVFDVAMRGVQPELSTRRWSSVQELSGHKASTQSPGIRTDRGSVQRRGGRGRQLDRHVYQCYFAGILHSTRPSDRFLRLQQMFAVLENIVEIETELFSGQRGPTPSQIDRRQSASQGVDATLNLSNRKYRLQRTLELQKLYAKLNTAQDGKEFFYDTGHLDAFQWKPWMDFGLNRKINSMTRLKEVFENAVVNGHCVSSTTTLTPLAQKCERGLSFGKVLGMFRRLEKRSRKETGARFRSQTSSQQSLDSIQKLEGTYIKMMESAARNAKTMALHGYHMNEHRNRYDAYVQSRRIYRPKSASNIFEKVSSDEDEIRTVTSSSTPPTTTGFSYSTRHHKQPSDMLAKPGSATMECPQIFSPARFVSTSTKCSEAATQVQDSLDSWATNHQLCQSVVSATAAKVANDHTLEGIQCGNTTPGRSLTVDDGRVAEELKHTTVLYGANSAAKSRKRDRQRPRCRNAHGRRTRSVNSGVGVAEPHSSAQRHIDVWRSSLCPPPGTINQVLDYFNSLCIEDSNDKKDHSTTKECNYSVNSLQSRDQINSVKNSKQLTTQLPTSTNNEKRSTSPPHVDCKRKFSTKVQQNVDDDDVLVVSEDKWQDMALPQLHSCNDEVRGAEFSTSSVSTVSPAIYSRAVNIDKRRRPLCVVDSVEVNSERPRYPGTDAKRPEVETDDYWAMSTQSDVVAGVEVSPMYVASPEVVQMLSESQQIQRNDAMSPVFIDCRHAVTRELHVHKSAWEPYANHLPSYNCASLSAGKRDNTTVSTLTVSSGKLPDSARSSANNQHQEMINNRCRLTKTSEIPNMGEGAGVSQQTCSSADETRASFVTTVSSPSFLCSACHQSLAVCNCASTAEARAPRGGKGWWNDANQDSVVKFISVKAAGDLALNVSRAGSELDVIRGRHQCQVTGVLDPALSERRPIPSETRGRHDAELWRMLNSLETINSEWTNGRPTRSTQILHPPVEMNSASQTQLKSNINDEHAETAVRVVECETIALDVILSKKTNRPA